MDKKVLISEEKIGFIKMLMNEETCEIVKFVRPDLYEAYQQKLTTNKYGKTWGALYPEWFIVSDESDMEYLKAVRDVGQIVYETGFDFFEAHLIERKILNHFGYEDYCDVLNMELEDFNSGKITKRSFFEYFLTQKELIYDDYQHIFIHLKTVDPLFVELLEEFKRRYNLV